MSGTMPPTRNTDFQPNAGMIRAANRPPSIAPNGNPQNIAPIAVARQRAGAYSPAQRDAVGERTTQSDAC